MVKFDLKDLKLDGVIDDLRSQASKRLDDVIGEGRSQARRAGGGHDDGALFSAIVFGLIAGGLGGPGAALLLCPRGGTGAPGRTGDPGDTMRCGPAAPEQTTSLRDANHPEGCEAGRRGVDGERVGYRQDGDVLHELRESEVARNRAQIGMDFQRFNLFGHMTALANVIESSLAEEDGT